jgi:hypothetical protein
MWIELHDSTRDHPKVLKLAKRLGVPKVQALGHVISLWCWTLRMAADGDLRSFDVEDIEIAAEWEGAAGAFVEAAIAVRLLDKGRHGFLIHDWEDYSGSLKTAQRTREWRKRKEKTQETPKRDVTVMSRDADRPTDRPTDQTDRPDMRGALTLSAPQAAVASPTHLAVPLVDGSEHAVTEADVTEWSAAFPGVDIPRELQKLRQWNLSHPRQRKTSRGIRAHITGWLSKAQDRSRPNTPGAVELSRKGQDIQRALAGSDPNMFILEQRRGTA